MARSLISRAIALLFTATAMIATPACFQEKEANTQLDLTKLPEQVAIVLPAPGTDIDVGAKLIGTTLDFTITLLNAGHYVATEIQLSDNAPAPQAPFSIKGGTFPGTGGTCNGTLAIEETCTVVLSYAPTEEGQKTGTVMFSYVNGTIRMDLEIALKGTTTAVLALSAANHDYGTRAVGSSTDFTVTVTNTGAVNATNLGGTGLADPFKFKGGSFPGTDGTCTTTLAPDANCTLVLTYNPIAIGASNDTLNVNYVDGEAAQAATLSLSGKTPAVLGISGGPTVDFQKHGKGSSSDKTLTVSNVGASDASLLAEKLADALAAPFSFKDGNFPGTGGTCTADLAAGATCTIVMTYSPTTAGAHSDALTLEYDNGLGSGTPNATAVRNLAGTGQVSWNATAASGLTGRKFASAIWTGTKAIFFGGERDAATRYGDGASYDPTADTWSALPALNAPSARSRHTATWTGSKMIIWGGLEANDVPTATGAIYDPALDTWTPMSTTDAPSARYGHTAIWDSVNQRLIIWGGAGAAVHGAGLGYAFDPANGAQGTWTALSDGAANIPSARYEHTAVWTGSKMIVWGGCTAKNAGHTCQVGAETQTGALFDAATDTWSALTLVDAPSARFQHAAIWDGTRMVIFGGGTDSDGTGSAIAAVNTGAIFEFGAPDTWTATSIGANVPSARTHPLAFSTPAGMLIWGGLAGDATGAILNAGSWSALSAVGAPSAALGAAAVFTGSSDLRLIVLDGEDAGATYPGNARIHANE